MRSFREESTASACWRTPSPISCGGAGRGVGRRPGGVLSWLFGWPRAGGRQDVGAPRRIQRRQAYVPSHPEARGRQPPRPPHSLPTLASAGHSTASSAATCASSSRTISQTSAWRSSLLRPGARSLLYRPCGGGDWGGGGVMPGPIKLCQQGRAPCKLPPPSQAFLGPQYLVPHSNPHLTPTPPTLIRSWVVGRRCRPPARPLPPTTAPPQALSERPPPQPPHPTPHLDQVVVVGHLAGDVGLELLVNIEFVHHDRLVVFVEPLLEVWMRGGASDGAGARARAWRRPAGPRAPRAARRDSSRGARGRRAAGAGRAARARSARRRARGAAARGGRGGRGYGGRAGGDGAAHAPPPRAPRQRAALRPGTRAPRAERPGAMRGCLPRPPATAPVARRPPWRAWDRADGGPGRGGAGECEPGVRGAYVDHGSLFGMPRRGGRRVWPRAGRKGAGELRHRRRPFPGEMSQAARVPG
jgi:hypothetical protein